MTRLNSSKKKRKDKRITLTQAQAQAQADALYWKILRMFLAAAMDVYGWKEQEVVDFAARVKRKLEQKERQSDGLNRQRTGIKSDRRLHKGE